MPDKTPAQEFQEITARILSMREEWRGLIEAHPDEFWRAQGRKPFDDTVVGMMFYFIDLAAAARIADSERIEELEVQVQSLERQILAQAPLGNPS